MPRDHKYAEWWTLSAEDVLGRLETSDKGLTQVQVNERLQVYGRNELAEAEGNRLLVVFINQFKSPLIYILMVAVLLTIIFEEYIDAAIIAAALGLNAVVGTYQEYRAERSIEALRRVASARAHVERDGREREVDARELVPGDIIIVEAGARLPADARLIFAAALEVDESLMTGESTTVAKRTGPLEPGAALAERHNMLFMGSTVTRGRGRAVVVATAGATELGQIAGSIGKTEKLEAPIVDRMGRFAVAIGVIVFIASIIGFVAGVVRGLEVKELFLTLVAMMVAVVPEGLPIVLTVTLAIGVARMARRNVIIRTLPAVETLGSCTVIGSDKTGTLTQNRMTVARIYAGGREYEVTGSGYAVRGEIRLGEAAASANDDEALRLILTAGVLNNEARIELGEGDEFEVTGDPTEIALLVAATKAGIWREETQEQYPRWAEVPFDSETRYAATFHHRGESELTFVKGAPEEVLAMCDSAFGDEVLDPAQVQNIAHAMAQDGLRVLGFAYRERGRRSPPAEVPEHRNGLTFLGLQGMIDPPRDEVKEAIRSCQEAGIRVVMITGDHKTTAAAIARQLGITSGGEAVTGNDIDAMAPGELEDVVETTSVFARVSPEHKLKIVQALQSRGEVVAVTGDGVNDGPALRAANLGVAMGKSGTDVAKEASDMVITDDNFVSIFAAVEEGRVVFDNVRKVTFFLIPTGAAVILTVLASIFFDFMVPFLPAQLIWSNIVTNGVQDVALAFEPGEKDVTKRKPRPLSEGIMSPLLWERSFIAGIVMAAGIILLFLDKTNAGVSEEEARTTALTTLVLFNALHIGNARSEHRSAFARSPLLNPMLLVGTVVALAIHFGALYWGPTQYVLRVEPLALEDWVRMTVVALSVIAVVEVHKAVRGPGRWLGAKAEV